MPFNQFKSVAEVARKFNISVEDGLFIEQRAMTITELYFSDLQEKLISSRNFINETTICETIIRPILDIVSKNYDNLEVWSHVAYNIDAEKGLVGEPDYLIAPKTRYGDMDKPALCVIEAKQEKFEEGWAQALAEMIASSLQGTEICYSMVTTGKVWEFGCLKGDVFTKDPRQISAISELQKLFEILNLLFYRMSLFK